MSRDNVTIPSFVKTPHQSRDDRFLARFVAFSLFSLGVVLVGGVRSYSSLLGKFKTIISMFKVKLLLLYILFLCVSQSAHVLSFVPQAERSHNGAPSNTRLRRQDTMMTQSAQQDDGDGNKNNVKDDMIATAAAAQKDEPQIRVLGICGGIGSGKSTVCQVLVSEFGCLGHIGEYQRTKERTNECMIEAAAAAVTSGCHGAVCYRKGISPDIIH